MDANQTAPTAEPMERLRRENAIKIAGPLSIDVLKQKVPN
jgi:hypothetical protein